MNEKPVILVDMDDVMADFYTAALTSLPIHVRRPRTEFYVERNYPNEFHSKIEKTYLTPGFFKNLAPIPGLHEGWQKLIDNGYAPRVASSPVALNTTCVKDKLAWLERVMVPDFGPSITQQATIDADKWKYPAIALFDDRPSVPRGLYGADTAQWQHILFGWENLPIVPLADTAFRLINWNDIDTLLPVLEKLSQPIV